ncbi:cupredoxin domain-containing protein [Salinibacter altiplanensis]|uniref:cupredoxin domain-containing protein n=1 Tax=Salinibacter altiplanensis TaxID=1803181 RepID=UPI001F47C698|nr:cupredoxin domain-containing protein [Salinibacter altiplanensis]
MCSLPPRRLLSLTLLAAGTLLLVACGSSDEQPSATAASSEADRAEADTTVIEVAMVDYAYKPSSINVPAGKPVTLRFTNEGTVEHYFVVGDTIGSSEDGFEQNLFSGVSVTKQKAEDETQEGEKQGGEKQESEEEEEGDHENEFELPPGGSGSMTFTLPESKAGSYAIACFETTGGEKHYQKGMEGTLTVTAQSDE